MRPWAASGVPCQPHGLIQGGVCCSRGATSNSTPTGADFSPPQYPTTHRHELSSQVSTTRRERLCRREQRLRGPTHLDRRDATVHRTCVLPLTDCNTWTNLRFLSLTLHLPATCFPRHLPHTLNIYASSHHPSHPTTRPTPPPNIQYQPLQHLLQPSGLQSSHCIVIPIISL